MAVPRWPICALAIVATFASTGPGSAPLASAGEPTDEWVQTSPDSVMDAESFEELAALADEQPVEQSTGDGFFASVTLGDGFNAFAGALRHYGDYNIHLVSWNEGNIEIYRDELQQVANEINAHNGLSIKVAAGTFAPPANWNSFNIPVGEIWVVIKTATPCGNLTDGRLGCGGVRGSAVIEGLNRWTSGIVWLSPTLSTQCDQPVIGHEIGHALGLDHYNSNYPAVVGVKQLMAESTNCATPSSFQSGDLNGVRWGAEPTPSNDSIAAAAAVCPGDSTVSASTWFATMEVGELAHAGAGPRRSVWFRYVPRPEQHGFTATISTRNDGIDDFNTVLAVYSGATPLIPVASNDDFAGLGTPSQLSFPIDVAQIYWVAVDGSGFARGETDVVFDLPTLADDLVPLCAPARVLDTRVGGSTIDGAHVGAGQIAAGGTYALPIAGRARIPANAASVVLNVTVVSASAYGFMTVFPCGEPRPTASNLNFFAGDVIGNAVFARIGTAQSVCFFSSRATHLVVDVSAYFPGGDALLSLNAPARLLETRVGAVYQTIDHEEEGFGPVAAGATYELDIYGRDNDTDLGFLDDAVTVVLNVTAIRPAAAGFVTVFPCGEDRPNASNLNFVADDVIPNAVLARVSAAGKVCLFSSKSTHLIVDVSGYFPNTDAFVPLLVPERMLDTRSPAASGATVDGRHVDVGRIAGGTTYTLPIAGRAGVPANAATLVVNVTALQPSAAGFVTVFACGQDKPNASSLNFFAGDVIPNLVVVRVGAGGNVCIYTTAELGLIVDVSGYFL